MSLLKDRVKQARKHADLTQRELAAAVGVSQPVISQLEGGENLQSVHLLKIASICGVNPLWLSEGEGEMLEEAEETQAQEPSTIPADAGKARSALDMVQSMLATKAGKGLDQEARNRLLAAAEEPTSAQSTNVITADFSRATRMKDGDIFIPQYDVRASMGSGQVVADYIEFVRNVVVNGAQLERLGVDYTAPENLSIVTGWGHSMAPTINDKDPVVVDRGVTEFIGEGIYVVIWQEHLYIKRLQMVDAEQIELISDNKKHKDRIVPVQDVTIQAKVVYIWNGNRA
ncbi:XRE family transcriptional regulator [Pseudomonas aeruginosa]|uniref:XRE family transcriptional regulator n=1 Tax=Pseudomonas aeruginosa TaxID=287 RepID=UPI001A289036|nr:XRE family transcriptional regulator [Pseudomonas aeruginosa]MBH3499150.1 helix-turn-helix domain-containing protein [Pseudomonas aeruginosa]MBV5888758.1 XRE family transcriptional regulator [Pseudomonas aeruginosa]MDA3430825.1 helix-turn-helix domain-containing protein [Pseudomonas aeruginosa]MDU0508415.1 XRE family transcriptional regulator [Pseudomonas aeruginosa]HEJ5564191.1 helix-turn-helix domain-containing protein [Pseudomonas aeruginosa]